MTFYFKKFLQTLFVFLGIFFISLLSTTPVQAGGKAGVNIGDHFGEIDQAAAIVGDGGWIVVMAQPGDCSVLENMILKYPNINFVIRGHHPAVSQMVPDHAKAWAYTLANMDTGGRKIYFYPINEPFTWGAREGFSDNDQTTANMVKAYTDALLNTVPNLRDKVVFLSPMINRSDPGFNTHVELLGRGDYFSQFDGIAMNLYDFQTCGGPFCHSEPALNAGEFQDTLNKMGVSDKPVYAVESGVVPPPGDRVVYEDQQLLNFYQTGFEGGYFNSDQLVMTATFSYDPHGPGWSIYNSQTADYFRNDVDGGTGPLSTSFDREAFLASIQTQIDDGSIIACDECGLSPVLPDGENFCAATGNYTLDIFPEYDMNDKDYMLYPICPYDESDPKAAYCGGSPQVQGEERLTHGIKLNLLEQGYQVHCAENELKIQGEYQGDWLRYVNMLANRPGDVYPILVMPDESTAETTQIVDYTNAKFPLFRDLSGKRWRMTSLEEFFGFRDIYSNQDSISLLNSSPAEKLLSEEQRCIAAVEVLKDAKTLCDREDKGTECALNTTIPDPTGALGELKRFDVLDMYNNSGLSCKQIQQTSSPDIIKLKNALRQTPLYLEKLYRLAFLVISIELKPLDAGQFFNFMSPPYGTNASLKHEARVVAFKIPDVGLASLNKKSSDYKLGTEEENIEYKDPMKMTRDLVTTTKQQEKVEEERMKERELFGFNSFTTWWSNNPELPAPSNVPAAYGFQNDESLADKIGDKSYDEAVQDGDVFGGYRMMSGAETINCTLTKGCGGESGVTDPMMRALIDFVNTKTYDIKNYSGAIDQSGGLRCTPTNVKISGEKVEIVGESTSLSGRENEPQSDDLGQTNIKVLERLLNISKDGTGLEKSGFGDFETQFQLTGENSVIATINTYLIYPGDYDAETISNAIRGPFVPFKVAQDADENRREGCDPYIDRDDCPPADVRTERRFAMFDGIMKFVGDAIPHTFYDLIDPPGCVPGGDVLPDGTILRDCEEYNFNLRVLSPDPHELAGIPGEKLGFWIKEVQKNLSVASSAHYEYLASCKTTEEFLLGVCGSGVGSIPGNGGFPGGGSGNGSCSPAAINNPYCGIPALMRISQEKGWGWGEETARKASIICNRESGGNPNAANKLCLTGESVDYSIGLFQFNMLAHCPGCLYDGNGRTSYDDGYDPYVLPCSVADRFRLEETVQDYYDPDYNLDRMYELSNGGRNWGAWGAASACGIE